LIEEKTASVETRGQLYMWMREVIEITQVKIFIAENVKKNIQSDFSSANGNGNTDLDPQILYSADFGVPQSRERVIFIRIRKSALKKSALEELGEETISRHYDPYPTPTHVYSFEVDHLKHFVLLKDFFNLR